MSSDTAEFDTDTAGRTPMSSDTAETCPERDNKQPGRRVHRKRKEPATALYVLSSMYLL